MSSGGEGDRSRGHLGVSQPNKTKKKKSRKPIYSKDILGILPSSSECITHDTHLFVVPFGTSHQLSAIRIKDSSSEQSDVVASTPSLNQHYVHHSVSPTPTLDETSTVAPGHSDRIDRVMIESDGSS
ncbi:hypothetical protein H5410_051826 [Solanum commersonii]|uniref:Uncharacterized protein n=1 Tax=Solanum commersonii TaxID=4109 RepID=A0A9J5X0J9_SOLCO|nr:hypothetical protein H5410_051826 [Solanum commersonii]